MKYRNVDAGYQLPFKFHVQVSMSHRVEYAIVVEPTFTDKYYCDLSLMIPTPPLISNSFTTSNGKWKYNASLNVVQWSITNIKQQQKITLKGHCDILPNSKWLSRPPIIVQFEIKQFNLTGSFVKHLKVEEESYSSIKWVRYVTNAGEYLIRF